jgi:arylsulfatase A-like enzyme
MDNRLTTYPKLMREAGYQTAIFGKWHLGQGPEHCPTGFDDWAVLPGQGVYHDPEFIFKGPDGGELRQLGGYATDLITDLSLDWLEKRNTNTPFCLMVHHKAPHRHWDPDEKHAHMYDDVEIPEPENLFDDYENRAEAARIAVMRVGEHMMDSDLKRHIPDDLEGNALRKWAYQYYIKDYLRVIASIDDNVGRLLDYLDDNNIANDTIIIYTSDQGFFLGDHGWYDKRFMYEESLRMPFIIRYPREIPAGSVNSDIATNVDFAPTFLDYANIPAPASFQGRSMRSLLHGQTPENWENVMYYRYWMNNTEHNTAAHYGIRTLDYKLVYYYADGLSQPGTDRIKSFYGKTQPEKHAEDLTPEWELFDLRKDPHEMCNVYHYPSYANIAEQLRKQLREFQLRVGDTPYPGERP